MLNSVVDFRLVTLEVGQVSRSCTVEVSVEHGRDIRLITSDPFSNDRLRHVRVAVEHAADTFSPFAFARGRAIRWEDVRVSAHGDSIARGVK